MKATSRLIASAWLAFVLPALASAQAPPKRAHHAIVYDDARERVLLTGGSSPFEGGECCAFFNDLWTFDGSRWVALPASGPQMSGMRLAFDSHAGKVVSFGGYSSGRSMSDLRVLEGDVWKTVGQHDGMAAAEPGFVYDARRRRFVAFGGSAGRGQVHGDTWEYDGSSWTKVGGAGPLARQAHAMVFDERRGRVVVFGGMGAGAPGNPPPIHADLWEFDGQRWNRAEAVNGPSARHSSGAAYDSKRGRTVVFGGLGADGFLGDTWSWDGRVWTKLADTSPNAPEPRAMGQLAYDRKRDRVVLFGGRKGWPNDLDDTWEWDGVSWRRVAAPVR